MQDRIPSGDVKIRKPAVSLAEIKTIMEGFLHLLPIHRVQFLAVVLRKNVTVLAPLVARVGDVPLKREVFHLQLPPDCLFFEKACTIREKLSKTYTILWL